MPYAEIIIEVANRKLDRVFHYRIPAELEQAIRLGSRVLVPFGNRVVGGFVTGFIEKTNFDNIKDIIKVRNATTFCTEELIKLAHWMAEYYMCPLSTVLQAMIPQVNNYVPTRSEQGVKLSINLQHHEIMAKFKNAPKQKALYEQLSTEGHMKVADLLNKTGASLYSLKVLAQKGIVEFYSWQEKDALTATEDPLPLTDEQQISLKYIKEAIDKRQFTTQLLWGVTGSGKTEVYLQALAYNRAYGKQAIVLLPEIALTEQMIERYKKRFGSEVVAWHSNLSSKKKSEAWAQIVSGQVSIIIGARSAVFTPFTNLGLIIIDEEHEGGYQQETAPKYHTREVALKRGELNKAVVLLGSATPSLETAYNSSIGHYQLLSLKTRVNRKPLPAVKIVDLRDELRQGNFSIFSNYLKQQISVRLETGEQTILFLNRRGYNSFFICRDCGYTIRCKACDISLTYHASSHDLRCHYCGYRQPAEKVCPNCGSLRIRGFGLGTEKVEQEVKSLFPEARIVRLDNDVSNKKGYRQELLKSFQEKKADILVGTQMIAKGLDFHNVTLVGVISADFSLNFPDFRSREKTFQLLTQVAGRAGRGIVQGEVVIQTYLPESDVLLYAQKQDFNEFYQKEIILRKELNYPPFCHIIRVLLMGENEEKVAKVCQGFAQLITSERPEIRDLKILGPAAAPITKLNNMFRWQVILKSEDLEKLRQFVAACLKRYHEQDYLAGQLRWSIDIDPIGML
ncbi:primosomal protein N' [Bacillota bacterium LX-D]|nr:primosomal protein N' [Bacillota bacterium LX-D]